jgi:hypothetical protein
MLLYLLLFDPSLDPVTLTMTKIPGPRGQRMSHIHHSLIPRALALPPS